MTGGKQESRPLHCYRTCGLLVVSDIALPGLIESGDPPATAQVTIMSGVVPEALDGDIVNRGPNWQHGQDSFLLRIPGVGRFLVEGARRIVYASEGHVPPADLTAFITGSVMGVLLHLRGHVVLHTSAILVGEAAVLFCGPSGAGKSTLAAALGQHGFPLLSDDLCAIDLAGEGPPLVYPDGRQHKLWARAIDGLDLADRRGQGVRHQLHKYHVDPGLVQTGPAPLAALYNLREARGLQPFEITRPSLPDAALIVRRNAYRPRMMQALGQQDGYFRASARIARAGGVHILGRPLDFARFDEVIGKLRQHWRAIGLEGA